MKKTLLEIKESEQEGLNLRDLPDSFFEDMGFDKEGMKYFLYQGTIYYTCKDEDKVVAISDSSATAHIKPIKNIVHPEIYFEALRKIDILSKDNANIEKQKEELAYDLNVKSSELSRLQLSTVQMIDQGLFLKSLAAVSGKVLGGKND